MKGNNIIKPSAIVQTQNLCKMFRNGLSEIKAADNVNINLSQGEFSAIVGTSLADLPTPLLERFW